MTRFPLCVIAGTLVLCGLMLYVIVCGVSAVFA